MGAHTDIADDNHSRSFYHAAKVISRLLPERLLYHLDSRIRSIGVKDWCALMRSDSRHYRVREWLVQLSHEAGHLKAVRVLDSQDRKREEWKASQPKVHTALGSACPVCGRASLHDGYCSGGILRRHDTRRRQRSIVKYYD